MAPTAHRSPILLGLAIAALAATAPIAGAQGTDEVAAARHRLKAMRTLVGEARVEAGPSGARSKVERIEDPIYRYDDPTRVTDDGTVWAWGKAGRPVALLTLSYWKSGGVEKSCLCEWTSLSPAPLAVVGPGPQVWAPQAADLPMRPIPAAPPPADTAAARSRQMGELSRRFRAHEIFNHDNARPERFDLRFLPKPIHRYADPTAGLVDGAIYVFANGTNPEVILLIEARRAGDAPPGWVYGLTRTAGAELHATIDGGEVWTRPAAFGTAPRDPYFMVTRPLPDPE